MSASLAVPLALVQRTIDHVSGAALAAALLVLAVLLALALAKWNTDDDELPPVELTRERPLRSVDEWRAAAQVSVARSRERRSDLDR